MCRAHDRLSDTASSRAGHAGSRQLDTGLRNQCTSHARTFAPIETLVVAMHPRSERGCIAPGAETRLGPHAAVRGTLSSRDARPNYRCHGARPPRHATQAMITIMITILYTLASTIQYTLSDDVRRGGRERPPAQDGHNPSPGACSGTPRPAHEGAAGARWRTSDTIGAAEPAAR